MSAPAIASVEFRHDVRPADRDAVRRIVSSSGFFQDHEIDVAVELVDAHLAEGPACGYLFVFADVVPEGGRSPLTAGYACWGEIPCTTGSHDLYWIAVDGVWRGQGLGPKLMERVEEAIRAAGGRRVYAETSETELYLPTRRFYEKLGFFKEASIADFYAAGDGKAIFTKVL